MAGPHSPNPTVGADGPPPHREGEPHQPALFEYPGNYPATRNPGASA